MVTAVVLSLGVWAGLPWPVAALLALGLWRPWFGLAGMAILAAVAVGRRPAGLSEHDEAVFHAAVAAELRAGASLRAAIVNATARIPGLSQSAVVRRATVGWPLETVASELATKLVVTGRLLVPAVAVAAAAGGRAAGVFDRLSLRAADEAALHHEMRVATAQARMSAAVVGGLPLVALGFAGVTGRLTALVHAGGAGVMVLVVGVTLVAAGLAVIAGMVWRHRR